MYVCGLSWFFFFSSRRRHTRWPRDWSSDVCSSDLIAEIVRGGIQSIDKGQTEAGRSIGLTPSQTMRYIVWPQAFKRIIPPLGNQFIISLKDTSLFSAIAVNELLYMGKSYANNTFTYFEPYLMVSLFYLAITIPSSLILRRVERRLDV